MTPKNWNYLLLALVCGALLGGCGFAGRIEAPQRRPLFDETVDSVVVRPFFFPPNANLAPQDVERMGALLGAELATRPQLKVFQTPPTDLPNTLILEPRVLVFQQREVPVANSLLREIQLQVQLDVFRGNNPAPVKRFVRNFDYQRIFGPQQPVPDLREDIVKLGGEVAEQFAQTLFPTQENLPIPLDTAFDADTGKLHAHPRLSGGNSLAEANRLDSAKAMWELVLFDPGVYKEGLFLLSPRSLTLLKKQGVPPEAVEKLAALVTLDERDLVDFRTAVRNALGGVMSFEGKVLVTAKFSDEKIHRNLAAAHTNLGTIAWFDKQHDLAAFHLARAFAHYPAEAKLEKWSEVQKERGVFPEGLTNEEAAELFLRLPPPQALSWLPGSWDRGVLPGNLVEPFPPSEAPGGPAISPVSLPPPPPTGGPAPPGGRSAAKAPGSGEGLPPIQTFERAGRG